MEDDLLGTIYIEKLPEKATETFNAWLSFTVKVNEYTRVETAVVMGRELVVDFIDLFTRWLERSPKPNSLDEFRERVVQWTLSTIQKVNPGVEMPNE